MEKKIAIWTVAESDPREDFDPTVALGVIALPGDVYDLISLSMRFLFICD